MIAGPAFLGGFLKLGVPFLAPPIIRIIVCSDYIGVPPQFWETTIFFFFGRASGSRFRGGSQRQRSRVGMFACIERTDTATSMSHMYCIRMCIHIYIHMLTCKKPGQFGNQCGVLQGPMLF